MVPVVQTFWATWACRDAQKPSAEPLRMSRTAWNLMALCRYMRYSVVLLVNQLPLHSAPAHQGIVGLKASVLTGLKRTEVTTSSSNVSITANVPRLLAHSCQILCMQSAHASCLARAADTRMHLKVLTSACQSLSQAVHLQAHQTV